MDATDLLEFDDAEVLAPAPPHLVQPTVADPAATATREPSVTSPETSVDLFHPVAATAPCVPAPSVVPAPRTPSPALVGPFASSPPRTPSAPGRLDLAVAPSPRAFEASVAASHSPPPASPPPAPPPPAPPSPATSPPSPPLSTPPALLAPAAPTPVPATASTPTPAPALAPVRASDPVSSSSPPLPCALFTSPATVPLFAPVLAASAALCAAQPRPRLAPLPAPLPAAADSAPHPTRMPVSWPPSSAPCPPSACSRANDGSGNGSGDGSGDAPPLGLDPREAAELQALASARARLEREILATRHAIRAAVPRSTTPLLFSASACAPDPSDQPPAVQPAFYSPPRPPPLSRGRDTPAVFDPSAPLSSTPSVTLSSAPSAAPLPAPRTAPAVPRAQLGGRLTQLVRLLGRVDHRIRLRHRLSTLSASPPTVSAAPKPVPVAAMSVAQMRRRLREEQSALRKAESDRAFAEWRRRSLAAVPSPADRAAAAARANRAAESAAAARAGEARTRYRAWCAAVDARREDRDAALREAAAAAATRTDRAAAARAAFAAWLQRHRTARRTPDAAAAWDEEDGAEEGEEADSVGAGAGEGSAAAATLANAHLTADPASALWSLQSVLAVDPHRLRAHSVAHSATHSATHSALSPSAAAAATVPARGGGRGARTPWVAPGAAAEEEALRACRRARSEGRAAATWVEARVTAADLRRTAADLRPVLPFTPAFSAAAGSADAWGLAPGLPGPGPGPMPPAGVERALGRLAREAPATVAALTHLRHRGRLVEQLRAVAAAHAKGAQLEARFGAALQSRDWWLALLEQTDAAVAASVARAQAHAPAGPSSGSGSGPGTEPSRSRSASKPPRAAKREKGGEGLRREQGGATPPTTAPAAKPSGRLGAAAAARARALRTAAQRLGRAAALTPDEARLGLDPFATHGVVASARAADPPR